jgi:CheY-like chemotaxis protein
VRRRLRSSLDATTSDGCKLRIAERATTNGGRVTTLSDITADVERSEQLHSAHALAEAASRTKSEFLASMSHELRTPLRPRVVITDLDLPGMNGVDATLQLADWPQTRDIPVIALSAEPMLHDPLRVRGAGFYRCLEKPVAVDELTRTLEELLAQ